MVKPILEVAVIGSLNVDFITRTPRVPAGGETLTANSFDTGFGGKGANQAVACARLTPKDGYVAVRMVGNVGDDIFGNDYCSALAKEGILSDTVRKLENQKTGIANIIVEEGSGENRILLSTGANHAFSPSPSEDWDLVPGDSWVCVFQLEIPLPVVLHNISLARKQGKHVILNPAPAVSLPESAYKDLDTLILNESEAGILAGSQASNYTEDASDPNYTRQYITLAHDFLERGIRDCVIITLGSKGSVFATSKGTDGYEPANKVQVVDTTAAGDTFVGAYAVHLATTLAYEKDNQHAEGIRAATTWAGRTVEKMGAMASIPKLEEQ
ncbi:Ribokinase-like protein [Polychaeton citri CBS 116435]|uniref:Ribokinase n=1 Tax=Polychaeton citri CBS 116435 TaxID=1314669 RepID=A0A9P4UUH3_9PEZI|nr:Ribokinase-like protein [Polychaeton citri CBS 116435]